MEIAELYRRAGETQAAADWYLRAAEYARDSGHVLGAIAFVKRGLAIDHTRRDLQATYATLWELAGLGGEPDAIDE